MTEQELRELIKGKTAELQPIIEAAAELIAQSFLKGLLVGIDAEKKM